MKAPISYPNMYMHRYSKKTKKINIHTEFKIRTHRKYIAIILYDTLSC